MKQAILSCARNQFSSVGYEHTTMRSIAREVEVDPALILHYFPNKYALFLAAILPTYEGPQLLEAVLADNDVDNFGFRMAKLFYYVMENKDTQMALLGMVRAAASEPQAAKTLQQFIESTLIAPLAKYLPPPRSSLKATLLGSHLVGLFVARYIIKIEPLASASEQEIISVLAPLLQGYVADRELVD